jgi:hypothetical protein
VTLDDLTVSFSHLDRAELLADWQWLIGTARLPILLTACGNAFVQDKNDGTVHFLNVGAGTLERVADSGDEFRTLLNQKQFVVDHFEVQLIGDLRLSGRALKPGEIYSLKHPPALGGEYVPSNVEACDIEVHFSIAGQLMQQVSALPEGTVVNEVKIAKRPWWRVW